ncbi:CLIPC6 family protein [Megaselia abdita]
MLYFPDDQRSNVLLKVNLTLIESLSCNKTLGKPSFDRIIRYGLLESQMCTFVPGKDTCAGDSGGPLQRLDEGVSYIVGITSIGAKCGGSLPALYTRVTQYIEWIENIVWP